jgi:SAM-dependent methyltransferase
MPQWFEDESFWEKLYPFLFPDERFEIADEQVGKLLDLVAFEGHTALDLACGPGRHSTALAKRGLQVTAVDLSPFLLEKARERAGAEKVEVEWVREDMRYFARPDAFDLVINMFTAFGYFDDKGDDLKVLRNIYSSLKKGGSFVIDVIGKEWLAKRFLPTISEELGDGRVLVQRHEIFDDWTRIRNRWTVLEDDRAATFRFHHTVYSGQELKDRLHQAGFGQVRLFGDLDGNEYGPDARRLIAAAWK